MLVGSRFQRMLSELLTELERCMRYPTEHSATPVPSECPTPRSDPPEPGQPRTRKRHPRPDGARFRRTSGRPLIAPIRKRQQSGAIGDQQAIAIDPPRQGIRHRTLVPRPPAPGASRRRLPRYAGRAPEIPAPVAPPRCGRPREAAKLRLQWVDLGRFPKEPAMVVHTALRM